MLRLWSWCKRLAAATRGSVAVIAGRPPERPYARAAAKPAVVVRSWTMCGAVLPAQMLGRAASQ